MSIIAEMHVPIDDFVLANTIELAPTVELEIVRVVSSSFALTPYIWAYGDRIDPFLRALEVDDSIAQVTTVDERNIGHKDNGETVQERLFRVTWLGEEPAIVEDISRHRGALLHASYTGTGSWELTALFPNRKALSALNTEVRENGNDVNLKRVYGAKQSYGGTYGVTEGQYEALLAAYRGGYFEVPREQNLTDLAEELDVSANALSARLRRGFRRLLSNTLVEEEQE